MPDTMQRSYDETCTPLHQVTFCVVDLETTGMSAAADAITEIGAVKVRGGEQLGTFQTLVRAEQPVMPEVSVLTGITDAMLAPAPPLGAVLPTLVEFIGGAVLVGHNVRFDVGFLDAALDADERPVIGLHRIDTLALARKLLKEDVDNCRLATLAQRFGLDNQPSHRALADALATVDLLHVLLERATGFGVQTLDELLTLPELAGHPHAAKLRLTARLPGAAGVYLLRDAQEKALFVGKADDIRAEVRGYFASTDGRRIGPMLRQLHSIQHRAIPCPDEATRIEARLIDQLDPRYNRQGGKRPRKKPRRTTPPEEPT